MISYHPCTLSQLKYSQRQGKLAGSRVQKQLINNIRSSFSFRLTLQQMHRYGWSFYSLLLLEKRSHPISPRVATGLRNRGNMYKTSIFNQIQHAWRLKTYFLYIWSRLQILQIRCTKVYSLVSTNCSFQTLLVRFSFSAVPRWRNNKALRFFQRFCANDCLLSR